MVGMRAVAARVLPQGAILLSILTFAAYAAGLVRDRMFARTYGAGTELDAYNAAFVLPELLLDVLVASGLTAPFVPVFTTLRARRTRRAAPRFAQTVLTLAVLVMSVDVPRPARARAGDAPRSSSRASTREEQALYVELFRMMLVTPILFAASITLGEVLVAERRFLFYALAPILYNVGHRRRDACSSTTRSGSRRRRSAPSSARRSTSGSGVVGMRRSPVRDPAPAATCGCPPCASSSG